MNKTKGDVSLSCKYSERGFQKEPPLISTQAFGDYTPEAFTSQPEWHSGCEHQF